MGGEYEAVIGLEVHCQLSTESKVFSPEPAAYGALPNQRIDPISLGHPGTLPLFNERVVEYTLRMGLATHCDIAPVSLFARKHYFYPDLPKGYQISQFEHPICTNGYIDITPPTESGISERRIGIQRIHMEEDAGKSNHDRDPDSTLLDFNRCGVPLIEIVSDPDLKSPQEAVLYLKNIRRLVRYLDICDGNMEEGSLRCDANLSIRRRGSHDFGEKVEIKNLNSFRHVQRALKYEIERQTGVIRGGGRIRAETRLWDDSDTRTRAMRSKEEAHDYRYFPEPDLAPVRVTDEMIETIRRDLPELPASRIERYMKTWNLPLYDATLLTEERATADYFEACTAGVLKTVSGANPGEIAKAVSNFLMTDVLRTLKEKDIGDFPISPKRLAGLVDMRLNDRISSTAAREIYKTMLHTTEEAKTIAKDHGLLQVSDPEVLIPYIEEVLAGHPEQADRYVSGKIGLMGFFIGQVMRRFSGSADPKQIRTLLEDRLARHRGR